MSIIGTVSHVRKEWKSNVRLHLSSVARTLGRHVRNCEIKYVDSSTKSLGKDTLIM